MCGRVWLPQVRQQVSHRWKLNLAQPTTHRVDVHKSSPKPVQSAQVAGDEKWWKHRKEERRARRSTQNPCTFEGCTKIIVEEPHKLQSHIDTVHLGLSKSYQCGWAGCGKTIKGDMYRLQFHINTVHLDIRRYKCDWEGCGQTFTLSSNLKEHREAVHLKTKAFQCAGTDARKHLPPNATRLVTSRRSRRRRGSNVSGLAAAVTLLDNRRLMYMSSGTTWRGYPAW